MKSIWKFQIALLILTIALSSFCFYPAKTGSPSTGKDEPFFGVTFGGNNTAEAKLLIDRVKNYTNLFIIANWDLAMNESALNELCQYAYDANLHFIVYFGFIFVDAAHNGTRLNEFEEAGIEPFHIPWLSSANDRWEDKFLGAYVSDEPGGKQIDKGHYSGYSQTRSGRNQTTFINVTDYSDAARRFVRGVSFYFNRLNNVSYPNSIPNATGRVIPTFTSDNALYWFDYLAGYNTVFAELGWNHNEAQHIGLCRGAANVQGKDWGAIVTWATNDPPYLASGAQMLHELNIAYSAGAKYLIVFNFPQINPYGALTNEHFQVIEQFWNQMHKSPRKTVEKSGQVALVLPKDYGWGMRLADDRIWGLWGSDSLAPQIGEKIVSLIKKYGTTLDIIYDDPHFNYTEKYSTIYYWNGTTQQAAPSFFNIPVSSLLYPSLAIVGFVSACVPTYVIIKNKKRKPPKTQETIQATQSKAVHSDFGVGELTLINDTLRFHKQKGRLKNQIEINKTIRLSDVECTKRFGSELNVAWKGGIDTFVIYEPYLIEKIVGAVDENLEVQRKNLEDKTKLRKDVSNLQSGGLQIADSLFDVLRGLHRKRIDWDQIQFHANLMQKIGSINLDLSRLSAAIDKRLPRETSQETYALLKMLNDHFSSLAKTNILSDGVHPDYKDAKTAILASYALNDIILSAVVGDGDNRKEIDELMKLIEAIPKGRETKKVSELKDVINRLGIENQQEEAIEESRMFFREFLP